MLSSCSSLDNKDADLYDVMLNHSTFLKNEIDNYYKVHTKSDVVLAPLDGFSFGGENVSAKYCDYVDQYTEPDVFLDWDEGAILKQVSADNRFSEEEKVLLAKALSVGYLLKTDVSLAITKSPEDDCLKAFNKAIKRATRDAALELIAAFFEPTCIAEVLVLILYYNAIDDAEEDYNDCMASLES